MDVADAEQGLDVGVVRMLVERVNHEDDGVDEFVNDASGNLDIATMRTGFDGLNAKADFVSEQAAGGEGGKDGAASKTIAVEGGKSHQVSLFAIVGDDG